MHTSNLSSTISFLSQRRFFCVDKKLKFIVYYTHIKGKELLLWITRLKFAI